MGFAGAMITEYPLEDGRYDQYEPFWAAAQAFDMPLSLHTATTARENPWRGGENAPRREQRRVRESLFYPATSMCDMIFSGVFERYPNLKLAIVEFELAWCRTCSPSMDYTYRERHEEALYRFKEAGVRAFHRNVFLSFQEDEVGIRLQDIIGVDNMMWGSDYPHSESTFPQSRQILAQILAGVPEDDYAKIVEAIPLACITLI